MNQLERNQNQSKILMQMLESDKLSHAYLFFGRGAFKKETALNFAEKILGKNFKTNPDFIVIDRDRLKIADMRKLISELSLRPYQSEKKVVIIEGFEEITVEAANSILKTLEEPKTTTILILLAENPVKLLPTVLSRVQSFHFDSGFNEAADGENSKIFSEIRRKSRAQRLLEIKNFSGFEADQLKDKIHLWLQAEEQALAKEPHRFPNLILLQGALSGLSQNLNKKLVLEKLFLNIV